MNPSSGARLQRWRAAAARHSDVTKALSLFMLATVLSYLAFAHSTGLNGPTYWRWPWRALHAGELAVGFSLALVPFALAHYLHAVRRWSPYAALVPVMLSLFVLELVAIGEQTTPFTLRRIAEVVKSSSATSYFTDALPLAHADFDLRRWLSDFPQLLGRLHVHSMTKPPGPILYYLVLIGLFGPEAAAAIGGLLIGLLATASVPATCWLIQVLSNDRTRGFWGASFLALTPGLVLFLPQLDQVYPVFACMMVGLWVLGLRTGRPAYAVGSGIAFVASCMFAFNLLVLGAFLVGYSLLWWRSAPGGRTRLVFKQLAWAVTAFTGIFVLLYVALRFDALATFTSAVRNLRRTQADIARSFPEWARPYPTTVLFDLVDFSLGAGWVGFVLAVLGVFGLSGAGRRTAFLCFGQFVVVAATGLLAVETARVWLFMLPLLMFPIDAELADWRPLPRYLAYASAALTLWAIARNMIFH